MHFVSGRSIFLFALVCVLFFAGGFSAGVVVSGSLVLPEPLPSIFTSSLDAEPAGVNFAPVWRTWNVLNEKFVPASTTQELSDEKKIYGLISGLTGSFGDPYTVFFPPEESEIFQADISGSFEGVGMEIGIRDNALVVITPLKGSPAIRAGLLSGDKITKIDDVSADAMPVDKAVKLIRGPRGTVVRFTILRTDENEPRVIPVTRDVIEIPTIETKKQDGVFIISLYNFSAVSANLFRGALREFALSGTPKLILDLRGNPGGYLEAAVDMASWFLPAGKVGIRFGNSCRRSSRTRQGKTHWHAHVR